MQPHRPAQLSTQDNFLDATSNDFPFPSHEQPFSHAQIDYIAQHMEMDNQDNYQESLYSTSPGPSFSSAVVTDPSYYSTQSPIISPIMWSENVDLNARIYTSFPTQSMPASTSIPVALRSSSLYPPPNLEDVIRNAVEDEKTYRRVRSGNSRRTEPYPENPSPLSTSDIREANIVQGRPAGSRHRLSGACVRCRKLKMKCAFSAPESKTCDRCMTSGQECVVLGRKPRSPGVRETLRKQIREKDAMIDNLLERVNPTATTATPLCVDSSKLLLTAKERHVHRDVLRWLERGHGGGNRMSEQRPKFDSSSLEGDLEDTSSSDDDSDQQKTCDYLISTGTSQRARAIPQEATPAGLLASSFLRHGATRASSADSTTSGDSGDILSGDECVDTDLYFQPGPSLNLDLRRLIIERQAPPDILLSGLVTPEDAGKLFEIYFKWINPIMAMLDENIHTPASVVGRCPFLFTVVCAVASRYYEEKPHMYGMAMHFAKSSAASSLIDGWKTVEMCQAYLLLSAYSLPPRRWEEDRSWAYTGLAMRLAIELNLGTDTVNDANDERRTRESLNGTRTWMISFIMDRCQSIQLGKSWMLSENETIANASTWCHSSIYQGENDVHLADLVEILRILSRFVRTTSPIFSARVGSDAAEVDFVTILKIYEDELNSWKLKMTSRHPNGTFGDISEGFLSTMMPYLYHYSRLVIFSSGLQYVSRHGVTKETGIFLIGCLQSGSAIIKVMVDGLVPTGFMRYSPEQIFVYAAFAAAVLLKCLRPKFSPLLDPDQKCRIVDSVKQLVEVFSSDQLAIDDRHAPRLYARLLRQLLEPHLVISKRNVSESLADSNPIEDTPPSSYIPTPNSHQQSTANLEASTSNWTMGDVYAQLPQLDAEQCVTQQNFGTGVLITEAEYLANLMGLSNEAWFV